MYRRFVWLNLLIVFALLAACAAPVAAPPQSASAPAPEAAATEVPAEEPAGEEAAVPADLPVVGFMKLVSHPALDAEQAGVAQALEEAGFVDGETAIFLYANAEGDIATLSTIAQKYVDDNVSIIIATSTPALQAAFNATKDIGAPPIVFNAVTSPYAAGVANAPDDHPDWVIGIQALAPVEDAMALVVELLPDLQVLGYIYNPAEANSVVNTEIAIPTAEELGITLEIATISNSSEVQTAAEALVSRGVEAFFVSTDSTVVSGLEALIKVANDNDLPLFANDPSSARRGAAVALGLDYFQDGLDTGALAVQILRGELDIAATPIERQRKGSLAINTTAAAGQGLELSAEFIARADTIFE
jgi:putative tryptophan/tyrosine transport system substrate-binding protein